MFKFLSESKQELEHVVWPTPAETKKYMYYTVGVIIIMSVLLAIVGYGLQTSLSSARTALGMGKEIASDDTLATQEELDALLKNGVVSGESASGAEVLIAPGTGTTR